MIEKTISEIEEKIRTADGLGDERKRELLQLLTALKNEAAPLKKTQADARSVKSSLGELRSSVEGFEKSHPKLVQLVNNISNTLSGWGI